MTIIYIIVSLVVLLGATLGAYLLRGPKVALGTAVVVFITLIVLYLGLVMFATRQM